MHQARSKASFTTRKLNSPAFLPVPAGTFSKSTTNPFLVFIYKGAAGASYGTYTGFSDINKKTITKNHLIPTNIQNIYLSQLMYKCGKSTKLRREANVRCDHSSK